MELHRCSVCTLLDFFRILDFIVNKIEICFKNTAESFIPDHGMTLCPIGKNDITVTVTVVTKLSKNTDGMQ